MTAGRFAFPQRPTHQRYRYVRSFVHSASFKYPTCTFCWHSYPDMMGYHITLAPFEAVFFSLSLSLSLTGCRSSPEYYEGLQTDLHGNEDVFSSSRPFLRPLSEADTSSFNPTQLGFVMVCCCKQAFLHKISLALFITLLAKPFHALLSS